jgi:hypothetical protein
VRIEEVATTTWDDHLLNSRLILIHDAHACLGSV